MPRPRRHSLWWKGYQPCTRCPARQDKPCLDIRTLNGSAQYATEVYMPHRGRKRLKKT